MISNSVSRRRAVPRVLIVEDEHAVCHLIGDILDGEGFQPDCVLSDTDAHSALEARGPYACVIVDVNLGSGTTGYDVARYARRLQPGLPVVFVSGQTSERSFRANGVRGAVFVAKPFTADELMARVRTLLGDNDH